MRVTVAGPELDSVGLLCDFVHLKKAIREVIRVLDHKYLNELSPFDVQNPSAENIARYLYDETSRQMPPQPNGAGIASVTVWEADSSFAVYRP